MVCDTYSNVVKSIKRRGSTEIFEKIDSARNIYVYGVGMVQSSIKKELKHFCVGGKILYDLSGYKESEFYLNTATLKIYYYYISIW